MFSRVTFCLALLATQALQASGRRRRRRRMLYQPVRSPIHTPERSPWYLLPTWESSLSVFGVMAKSDVHLGFTSEAQNIHVVISLNVTEYGGESQMSVITNDSAVTVVSRDNITLSADRYIWFSTFRKESVFALVRHDSGSLPLLYSNVSADLDFYTCNVFQVWSSRKASWDFRGEKYLGIYPGAAPSQPALVEEVHGVVRGLAERIMAIDFFLDHNTVVGLPPHVLKQLTEVLDDLNPFFLMFRFYGYDFFRFLKIIPTDNIMRTRNDLSTLLSTGSKAD